MTDEIVPADEALARRAPMMAGGRPMAIVPQSMEDCYRLANAVCAAGMAPKGLETPERAMVAIMHGLEIGLTPMAALQRIAVVNGRPTIWGDGAVGLVRGSGLCEWIKETLEGAGDAQLAICESMRKGEPEPIKRSFSVADAKKAGLWGKAGPWQQFPTRMLAMRARAFCLRDGFADVLGGLYLKEEIDNGEAEPQRRAPSPSAAPMIEARAEPAPATLTPAAAKVATTPAPARRAPSPSPAPASQQEPAKAPRPAAQAPQHFDPEKVRKRFEAALKEAATADAINDAWMQIVDPWDADLMPPDRDDFARMCSLRQAEIDGKEGAEP